MAFGKLGAMGRGMGHLGALGNAGYSPEALAIFAQQPADNSAAYKNKVNSAVVALKNAGIWSGIDALQLYFGPNEQSILVDWKVPTRTASLVSSPTFVVDDYVATDGVASYIDTNFNPVTDAVNSSRNNAAFGIYTTETTQGGTSSWAGWVDLAAGGTSIAGRTSTDTFTFRVNQQGTPSGGTSTDGSGLIVANRSGASATQFYARGSAVSVTTSPNVASSAPYSGATLKMGHATSTSFTARKFRAFIYARSLDASEQATLKSILDLFF
jgi:hypothetical protein